MASPEGHFRGPIWISSSWKAETDLTVLLTFHIPYPYLSTPDLTKDRNLLMGRALYVR